MLLLGSCLSPLIKISGFAADAGSALNTTQTATIKNCRL